VRTTNHEKADTSAQIVEVTMSIYMKYEGVTGEVTEKSHKGWVELKSFEFGVPGIIKGPSSSVSRGKPVSEATITKPMDSTSTQFNREWEWGNGKNVTIDFVYDDGTVYYRLEMKDTLVSGYSPGSSNSPIERITLNFTKVTFTQPAPLSVRPESS
jgi:type VI secretion system secreted protein Hcp